jgi:hypothetical protein
MISHSYNTRHAARLRSSTPERRPTRAIPTTPTKASIREPENPKKSVKPKKLDVDNPPKYDLRSIPASRPAPVQAPPAKAQDQDLLHLFADAYHREIMSTLRMALPETRIELIREIVRYPQHLPLLSEYLFVIHDRDGQKQTEKGVLKALDAWKEFYGRGVNKVVQDDYHSVFFDQIRTVCALAL